MTVKDRYENDAGFRTLVDMFSACIERGEFTPTEIREAAMVAQIRYEAMHPRPTIFTKEDFMRGKV